MKISSIFYMGVAIFSLSIATLAPQQASKTTDVPVTEDLMREHGILNRVLLIYEEVLRRLDKGISFNVETLSKAAYVIRDFIEDYHERLEESHIFPVFERAKQLTDLTKTLREQHIIGRKLTDEILNLASKKLKRGSHWRKKLVKNLRDFTKLYRAHESREDTELFPKLRNLLSAKEYEKLSDFFEDEEERRYGKNGYEKNLNIVMKLEQDLGISKLSVYNPS